LVALYLGQATRLIYPAGLEVASLMVGLLALKEEYSKGKLASLAKAVVLHSDRRVG
jgi:hypothetical protein